MLLFFGIARNDHPDIPHCVFSTAQRGRFYRTNVTFTVIVFKSGYPVASVVIDNVLIQVGASTGYTVFVWLFGIFAGGYHYALKMFVFEKVRNMEFEKR